MAKKKKVKEAKPRDISKHLDTQQTRREKIVSTALALADATREEFNKQMADHKKNIEARKATMKKEFAKHKAEKKKPSTKSKTK